MAKLGFLCPEALLALLALLPLWHFLRVWEIKRQERSLLVGVQSESMSPHRVFLPLALMMLLIIPLSRPYFGFQDIKINTHGHDIFALVDISRSMLTDDVSPSRLGFAKRKLKDLINLAPSGGVENRIGLILFAGDSYLFCPPTSDLAVVSQFVDVISPDLISSQGSALTGALDRALQSAAEIGAIEPLFLVLSDGEEADIDVKGITSKISNLGLHINALGFGTPEGKPIPLGDGSFIKNSRDEIVVSKLNEQALSSLAKDTGGLYYRARLNDSDLRSILTEVAGSHPGITKEKTVRIYNELGPFFLWLPAILILLSLLPRKSYVLPALLIACFALEAKADPLVPLNRHAYEAYESGNYALAEKLFRDALTEDPKDRRSTMGLGSSLFKLKRFKEAQGAFKDYIDGAESEREAFEGLYNLGNAYLFGGDPKRSIPNYENALVIKPDDKKAAANLEIAREMLKTPPPKQQQQQEDQERRKKDQNKSQENDGKDSKSEGSTPKEHNQSGDPKDQGSETPPSENQSPQKDDQSDSKDRGGSGQRESEAQRPAVRPSLERGSHLGQMDRNSSSDKKLSNSEAEAWLDSLPDAPLLVPEKRGRTPYSREQTW